MSPSLDPTLRGLDDCGCCEGTAQQTPTAPTNRPGLTAVSYRVGTHSRFKQSMLARLSSLGEPALLDLKSRRDDDFSVALLDAWSTVCDVLTFYQERIANESYLRTATERASVLQLARAIGYELRPGVAATVDLAFTVEDAPGTPGEAVVPVGTQTQSIPGPDELPQTFESSHEAVVRAPWNAIRPRMTQPQNWSIDTKNFVIKSAATNLKPGDSLLIVKENPTAEATELPYEYQVQKVVRVTVDPAAATTTVDLQESILVPPSFSAILAQVLKAAIPATFQIAPQSLTNTVVSDLVLANPVGNEPIVWNQPNLTAMAQVQNWSLGSLTSNIHAQIAKPLVKLDPIKIQIDIGNGDSPDTEETTVAAKPGVFVMRQRTALFGHNAPQWASLPVEQRSKDQVYEDSWDSPPLKVTSDPPTRADTDRSIYLDNTYTGIVNNSWVVLENASQRQAYVVVASQDMSRADYSLTAKVTRLTVNTTDQLDQFKLRETTVLAGSEELMLADLPIHDLVEGTEVTLDGLYLDLEVGRKMIVTGIADDLDGVEQSEVMTIVELTLIDGYTVVTFTQALEHSYVRDTVMINANVVEATHGQTKTEVLGSGDGTKTFQRFTLRQPPLTHVSAATPTGAASTLWVYVNDILWHEVPTLLGQGPDDRVYVTRMDDQGNTTVQFGDGRMGARLPTGQENITAVYRKGIGLDGLVQAGQITLMPIRPLGVRSVVNPREPSGAEDRESRDNARLNAPLTVLTLDRIVSLRDYEDFTRAFAGIAKALATWTWHGQQRGVFITVAGPEGTVVASDSATLTNLKNAISQAGDPHVVVEIQSYTSIPFQLVADLRVQPDYQDELVKADVERALRDHFSFDRRRLGQPVFLSEVVSVIQAVPGVAASRVPRLFRTGTPEIPNRALAAAIPVTGTRTEALPAELLFLDPRPLSLGVLT